MIEVVNVSDFLRQYESENTKRNYAVGLKQFFNFIYDEDKDLDVLSEKYLAEVRDHRGDLLNFRESLENKSPKTRMARLNVVRIFLDENGVGFPKRFFKNLNGRGEAITWEDVPTNEELKRIVEYMPVNGKALTLVLSSSGMRVGEAVQLQVSDIEFDRDPARIKIRGEYTKTGKKRVCFINMEAKEAVEEWLRYREQYIETAFGRSATYTKDKSDCLFPFTQHNFNVIWRNSLKKAGLLKIDPKTNRVEMRPHNLRKYFRLRVGRYGRDEAEALMGHQRGLNTVYARFIGEEGNKRLEEVYKQAIPDLSIYERTVKSTKAQMDIMKENRKLREEMELLKLQRDEMWREIDKLTQRVESFELAVLSRIEDRMIAEGSTVNEELKKRIEQIKRT